MSEKKKRPTLHSLGGRDLDQNYITNYVGGIKREGGSLLPEKKNAVQKAL